MTDAPVKVSRVAMRDCKEWVATLVRRELEDATDPTTELVDRFGWEVVTAAFERIAERIER